MVGDIDGVWDCIVVGGGAAGLTAALTLGRARRRTLVVDAGEQSNLVSHGIGGFLGYDRRPPAELYAQGRSELKEYPSVELRSGSVVGGSRQDDVFELELDDGARERSRTVLLATGMSYRPPEIPGVAERWGRSVFHCPFCHAWELRDRTLGVLDPSGSIDRALLLRFWSENVTLFTNGAEPAAEDVDRLGRAGVTLEQGVVSEVRGPDTELEAVVLDGERAQPCEGLLVPAPMHQRSDLATQLGAELAGEGPASDALKVDPMFRTSVPGLFAAGDTGTHAPPSVAAAIGAGSTAAKAIVHDLIARVLP